MRGASPSTYNALHEESACASDDDEIEQKFQSESVNLAIVFCLAFDAPCLTSPCNAGTYDEVIALKKLLQVLLLRTFTVLFERDE